MFNYDDVLNFKRTLSLTNKSSHDSDSFLKLTESYNYIIKILLQVECIKSNINYEDTIKIMNRYSDYNICYMDFNVKSKLIEESIFKKLNIPFEVTVNKKQDVIIMLKSILNEYYRELNRLIMPYNKEELFLFFYSCASSFSHIITYANNMYYGSIVEEESDIAKTIINENIDLAALLLKKNPNIISHLSAKEKTKFDFIIHYISCVELNYENKKILDMDIQKIFFLLQNIVEVIVYLQTVKQENADRSMITITNTSISIDEGMSDYINSYFFNLSEEIRKTKPKNLEQLMKEFENKNGYSPKMFMRYLCDVNKYMNCLATLNFVEYSFLVYDLCKSLGISEQVASNLIENFKLHKINFNNLEQTVSGKSNRIFRNPIIQVGGFLILSHDMLIEACYLFEKRILKSDISRPNGKLNKMIKSLYDEEDLEQLSVFITDFNLTGGINYHLQENKFLKNIKFGSGDTEEIDFYLIYDNILYVMEYKNWDSERTLADITKLNNKAKKVIKKLIKLKVKIIDNKQEFINAFEKDFFEVKIFLSFKYPLACINSIENSDVKLSLFNEFFDYIQIIVDK